MNHWTADTYGDAKAALIGKRWTAIEAEALIALVNHGRCEPEPLVDRIEREAQDEVSAEERRRLVDLAKERIRARMGKKEWTFSILGIEFHLTYTP